MQDNHTLEDLYLRDNALGQAAAQKLVRAMQARPEGVSRLRQESVLMGRYNMG